MHWSLVCGIYGRAITGTDISTSDNRPCPFVMSFPTLRLHIPASTTSATLLKHRDDSDGFSAFPQKYPEHKLTLEAVKRIWLSYSPVNIHSHHSLSHAATENCRVNEENVLCLDLGLTASVPSATASNSSTTDSVSHVRFDFSAGDSYKSIHIPLFSPLFPCF